MSRVQPPGVPVPFAQPFGRANSWPGCGHVVSDGAMKSSIVNHVFGKWLTNVVAVVRSVQSAGSGGEVRLTSFCIRHVYGEPPCPICVVWAASAFARPFTPTQPP